MNGVVKKLYDIDSIVIPEEFLDVHVDEQQVEEEVERLSVRCAKESLTEVVSNGDMVVCQADPESYPDGRTIQIYTGMQIPGAEQAEAALCGKKTGETCQTALMGKNVTLTIRKVIRLIPAEVTDELVAGLGQEGVKTIEEYKKYIRNKMAEDQQMEKTKEAIRYVLEEMTEKSEYAYDEAEMDAYVKHEMEQYAGQMDEGEDEDVTQDEMRNGIIGQEKQRWMAEAFCREKGIEVDLSNVEKDADQMIEMMQLMGEAVPEREEMIRMTTQDAYFNGLADYINTLIAEKLGGSYGNR